MLKQIYSFSSQKIRRTKYVDRFGRNREFNTVPALFRHRKISPHVRSFPLVWSADVYSLRIHISDRSSTVRKQKHRFPSARAMDFRYAAFRVNSVTVFGFAVDFALYPPAACLEIPSRSRES